MSVIRAIRLIALVTVPLGHGALAQEDFDNPTPGSAPCIVLNGYEVQAYQLDPETPLYRGRATIENICGRTMDVAFCFVRTGPYDETERDCYGGPLRPGSTAELETPAVALRITSPEIKWRYLE